HGVPLAGLSPASFALDPFWTFLCETDVVCTTHLAGQAGFLASSEWVHAEAFDPGVKKSQEIGLEPYSFTTVHLAVTNFLTCMVFGGVFERFPRLRFGALELGSAWLGPLADSLDMWVENMYRRRLAPYISRLPSEYLRQNVRVTP